jgi:hypothetical protein
VQAFQQPSARRRIISIPWRSSVVGATPNKPVVMSRRPAPEFRDPAAGGIEAVDGEAGVDVVGLERSDQQRVDVFGSASARRGLGVVIGSLHVWEGFSTMPRCRQGSHPRILGGAAGVAQLPGSNSSIVPWS